MRKFAAFFSFCAVAVAAMSVAACAHERWDDGQGMAPPAAYGPPPAGANYNFYGPTTNYFGAAPGYGQPYAAPDAGYGQQQTGYYGSAPYYDQGYYGYGMTGLPPQDAYDDTRLDAWHGYNPYDGTNGY